MNELTCNSICQLLCCPPVPSKIAAKLAFMPPPASYQISSSDDDHYSFAFAAFLKDSFLHFLPDNMEVTRAKTSKGNSIAILYMRTNPNTKLTFLLSHGNAVDLGLMVNFMHELGSKLNVNMMCYDYSGYGASSGKPLEKNLYADAECALDVLRTKFMIPLDQIVLYGQSIGTVPTVHLATLYRVAAVVLHSPLMSGLRVAFPRLKRNYCCDVFSNLARAPRILSPTLVIHGTRDEVVHINHGYRICSALSEQVLLDPLFIDGAGHNDCEMFPQYLIRLSKLVSIEIPRLRVKNGLASNGGNGGVVSSNMSRMECNVHRNQSQEYSSSDDAVGDETEVSPSSSHRLSQEFRKQSSTSSKRSTPSSRSSRRRISPLVVDNLKALLLKRPPLHKRSTAPLTVTAETSDLTKDLIDECNPSTLSPHKSSSETNVISSHVLDVQSQRSESVPIPDSKATLPITLSGGLEQNTVDQGSEGGKIKDHPCGTIVGSVNQLDRPPLKSDLPNGNLETDVLEHLILPPPPPPPSTSLLAELPTSSEALWSMHAAKGRKTFTLPQNFNPRRLLNTDSNKQKTGTLPREFRHVNSNALKQPSPLDATSSSGSARQSASRSSTMSTSSDSSSSSSSFSATADDVPTDPVPSELPVSNGLEPTVPTETDQAVLDSESFV